MKTNHHYPLLSLQEVVVSANKASENAMKEMEQFLQEQVSWVCIGGPNMEGGHHQDGKVRAVRGGLGGKGAKVTGRGVYVRGLLGPPAC